jgi:hypothetical protein|tara:strand:- start:294 stop:671 length:378 start_codon:yes stop_codon:yes gene_type:complete
LINRIIKRNEPKKDIFKDASDTFYRDNPKVDIATICIYEGKPKRSEAQSRLYFTWRDILSNETGTSKKQQHKDLKVKFIEGRSTKELTIQEFVDFLNEIDEVAAEYDIVLPRTNDYQEAMYGKID